MIEVYQSEKVIVEWVVTSLSGGTYKGRADSGRVASTPGMQGLKIFLREEDINATSPPLELQEELINFGKIKDSKHVLILPYILMQDDLNSIEDTLHRRGIPNDIPEFGSMTGKPPSIISISYFLDLNNSNGYSLFQGSRPRKRHGLRTKSSN
jgi:hypothetical protein